MEQFASEGVVRDCFMDKQDNFKNQEVIEKLWQEILQINEELKLQLKEWNLNYFIEHKNRFLEDLKTIKQLYKGNKILEIGSFPCHLTFCLKELRYPIIGIDIDPDRCKPFIEKNKLDIIKCDIEQETLPFKDNSFELLIFNEIFEHLRINPIKTLEEINRVITPNGLMLLTTPNLYSLRNIVLFNLGKGFNDPYEEFKQLDTVGHMGHIRSYSAKEMTKFLNNTGFEIVNIEFKTYHRSKKKIIGNFIDLLYLLIKRIRPFQVIICKKRNKTTSYNNS